MVPYPCPIPNGGSWVDFIADLDTEARGLCRRLNSGRPVCRDTLLTDPPQLRKQINKFVYLRCVLILPPSTRRPPGRSLHVSATDILYEFHTFIRVACSVHIITFDVISRLIFDEQTKLWSSSLCCCLRPVTPPFSGHRLSSALPPPGKLASSWLQSYCCVFGLQQSVLVRLFFELATIRLEFDRVMITQWLAALSRPQSWPCSDSIHPSAPLSDGI
jgi:hypothetical protein